MVVTDGIVYRTWGRLPWASSDQFSSMDSITSGIKPSLSIRTGTHCIPCTKGALVIAGNENSSTKKESPGFPSKRKHLVIESAFPKLSVTSWFEDECNRSFSFFKVSLVSRRPAPAPYWKADFNLIAHSFDP